jgi:hypothetical protein
VRAGNVLLLRTEMLLAQQMCAAHSKYTTKRDVTISTAKNISINNFLTDYTFIRKYFYFMMYMSKIFLNIVLCSFFNVAIRNVKLK